jgi:hypothetical protein
VSRSCHSAVVAEIVFDERIAASHVSVWGKD